MVGYQMISMPNDIRNSHYDESILKNSRHFAGERDPNAPALNGLDPSANLWKCNIWGTGDFSSGLFGSKSREPLAVRKSNTTSSFRPPDTLTSYGPLISSREAEGRSRLAPSSSRRSELDYATSPETREPPLQNANSHAVFANRDVSVSPGPFRRDQSLGRMPSRLPSLITNNFANIPRRANVSPCNSTDASNSTWTGQVSPSGSRASVSNYPGSTSRATSYSGSLPPSRQGNDSATFAKSLEMFTQGRQGSSSSIHTPFVTLTEPATSPNTDVLSTLKGLSVVNNARTSIPSMAPNVAQNGYPSALDRMGFQSRSNIRKAVIHPQNYSLDQNTDFRNSVSPHQFVDHRVKHRHTYPMDQRFGQLGGSANHQGPIRHPVELSSLAENNPYTMRSDLQRGSVFDGPSGATGRDLGSLQNQHYLLDTQMQQLMNSFQTQTQLNGSQFGNASGELMRGYSQSPSMSTFRPVVPMYDSNSTARNQDSFTAVRSTLMQEFKSNHRTNKRYELKDIYEHIAEFSGDQHGSRFIQQKLENATSDEKERIFQEIQPNTMQLTCDVFGNYVIQKFFEHGDQNQKKILANRLKGHVLSLSLQTYACRVVQKALEHILVDQQVVLIKELEHHVLRCVKDQNGNHVIQKAIERLPSEHIQFIIDAFAGQVQSLAAHSYGCRVIQRLIERARESSKKAIMRELHACVPALIGDQFGNYVIQHMIEYGGPKDRAVIINMIHNHLVSFATHKFASNVVEQGLVYASDEQRHGMLNQLLRKNDRGDSAVGKLIQCGYGNYVLQKFLDTLNSADYATFAEALHPELQKAKRINAGNGVKNIPAIEKKMRRFDGLSSCPRDSTFTSGNFPIFPNANDTTLPSTVFTYNYIGVEAV